MESTLLWYDLETFGLNANADRIASFAAVRTNDRFEVMGEPITLYSRLSADYLPNPGAVLVNGLNPFWLLEHGLREVDLAAKIYEQFHLAGTCVVGYNNIRFDDEFIRRLFYRNFYPPYEFSKNRWDIIDLVLATHDLRPDGITWPLNSEGHFSFTLSSLAHANDLTHENPHEALSDVYATIALAKLIKQRQPKLFDFHFKQRSRYKIERYINLNQPEPFVHTSRQLNSPMGATTVVLPLMADSVNKSKVYLYDLRYDPSLFLASSPDEVRRLCYTSRSVLNSPDERIHIKGMQTNKCPVAFPLSVLDDASKVRLNINLELCLSHAKMLLEHPTEVKERLLSLDGGQYDGEGGAPTKDVDFLIYDSFFSNDEQALFKVIRQSKADELMGLKLAFNDERSDELLRRYIGRNYASYLDSEALEKWRRFCANRLTFPPAVSCLTFKEFRSKIGEIFTGDLSDAEEELMHHLFRYGRRLEATLL